MAIGEGKYNDICTEVRDRTKAKYGVVLIVLGGERGYGMSAQLTAKGRLLLPGVLRLLASDIEKEDVDA